MKKALFLMLMFFSQNLFAMGDPPAVHGMLFFGDGTHYASHLPMFHKPHDYQLIMEVSIETLRNTAQILEKYEQAKKEGKTLFTLAPKEMDLTEIINGEKTTFLAQLFEGHFEKGGVFLGLVSIKVDQIIKSSKLDGGQEPGVTEEYLFFGKGGEYYAAHLIKEKPSFDYIAKINQPYSLEAFCGRRICHEPDKVLVKDENLPVASHHFKAIEELPLEGETIGAALNITGYQSEILSVLYKEKTELSH